MSSKTGDDKEAKTSENETQPTNVIASGGILSNKQFSSLPLSEQTASAINEMGYETMTEIQAQVYGYFKALLCLSYAAQISI